MRTGKAISAMTVEKAFATSSWLSTRSSAPARRPRHRRRRGRRACHRLPRLLRQPIRHPADAVTRRGTQTSARCSPLALAANTRNPATSPHGVRESGRPAEWFFIQESGGTVASVEKGKEISRRPARRINARRRECRCRLADLVVGSECGGSDVTSGIAGNPAVGAFFDRLVDAGGIAIFEEIVEMIGLRDVTAARAATPRPVERNCRRLRQSRRLLPKRAAVFRFRPATLPAASPRSKKKVWARLPKAARRPSKA